VSDAEIALAENPVSPDRNGKLGDIVRAVAARLKGRFQTKM
jgi:hypothetical protein